ncbi:hypothetical protein C8J56DRAFT_921374 [Mycena floridula]|nr:hypothetical protein C8J56DRAFT_921374 [Mycena floridula]
MRNQVGGSFVKRITRHLENAALLEECMSSLGHAVTIFKLCASSSARLAILGPGGIGKSSLTLALLYHSEIIAKYGSRRYWIGCDSCNSAGDVMAVLAATFGVEDHGDPVNAILRRLEDAQDPSLLVLDNFETPWEGPESRAKVEDLLSRLTELDQLNLIITMRGAERPGQVKWTRPFMRPLEPLSYDAARETFLEISGVSESDPHLDELLALTDNLPLAVALMAGVAESETCDVVLKRWKSENTLLLSDGFDKRSNLEKSIGLSLHCPRMLALSHARDLLSILAFLPDGISDSELQKIALPSIQIGPCRTTLCRTSLAYINHDGRLRVLAPIREYILSTLPPLPTHLNSLRRYIFSLTSLLDGYQRTPGIARKLISSIGNISFTIQHILEQNDTEVKDAVNAVIHLSRMYSVSKLGSFDLLNSLSGPVETLKDDEIRGKYILALASQSDCTSPEAVGLQAIEVLEKTDDRPGLAMAYEEQAMHFIQLGHNIRGLQYARLAFLLAAKCNNLETQAWALFRASAAHFGSGNYAASLYFAQECESKAQHVGSIILEASSLSKQATALAKLGNLHQASILAEQAHQRMNILLIDETTFTYYPIFTKRGDIHVIKTEYEEARKAFEKAALITWYGRLLSHLVILLVDLAISPPPLASIRERMERYSQNVPRPLQPITTEILNLCWGMYFLHSGDMDLAVMHCLKSITPESECETVILAFQVLADIGLAKGDTEFSLQYSVLQFALCQKSNDRPGRLLALRRIGDVFLANRGDLGNLAEREKTAVALFELALEGFTTMDIHRGRADCLLRLGDIHQVRGDTLKAKRLWTLAKPLFKRSSQGEAVQVCIKRLAENDIR